MFLLSRIDASTRLRRAIINNDLLLVKRILKNSPESLFTPPPPSTTTPPGTTTLHLACSTSANTLPIVTHLIVNCNHESSGISRDSNGTTPLMTACQNNNIDVVRFLANRFPKMVDWRNKAGFTALMVAAQVGNDGCVKALLEEAGGPGVDGTGGVDVDAMDAAGNTALHYASAYGHLKTIRTLIENNASPHIQNRQKYTPQEFSFTTQAEQYFSQLVAEKEARDAQLSRNTRPATPVFGRSEKAVMTPGRQRASSGS